MSNTRKEYWMGEALKYESWFNRANYMRVQQEADNVALRELVRHLYECMCNVDADGNHECDSCEYNDTERECDFERLMRELGIEVDE